MRNNSCIVLCITMQQCVWHVTQQTSGTEITFSRTLRLQVVRCCLLHIIQKGRYIATNRRSIFFRLAHNAGEMEAYCNALCQLRALLYLAQRMLNDNRHGDLFLQDESGLSESFVREYSTMHKGCFYGRCLGFQVR